MGILVGDIGGTKSHLAIAEPCRDELSGVTRFDLREQKRYPSGDFPGLGEVIRSYFEDIKCDAATIDAACFGVPGPVIEGQCKTVNLPWTLDERALEKFLSIARVRLINDLEAAGFGVPHAAASGGVVSLRDHKSRVVAGRRNANRALISPGTGLGEAILFWDGRYVVSPCEGGHCDFGPQDEEQVELLKWLWQRHKHVSWEHVASGPGIYRMYRFLRDSGREKEPADLAKLLSDPATDPSPIIGERAVSGQDPICVRAMDLWLFCVGAEAGNLALKTLCFGGLFIGGGIASKILKLFERPAFLKGFGSKGRMSEVLKPVPIYAVTDPLIALYGAASAAVE